MADAPAAANRLDRDYTQPTLQWSMGAEYYPVAGRYLYVTVTSASTSYAEGIGPDGLTIRGPFGEVAPTVGERWRVGRTVSGEFVFDDVAVST